MAQELDWAKSAGGTGDDTAVGIATDAVGNSYLTELPRDGDVRETNQTKLTAAAPHQAGFVSIS